MGESEDTSSFSSAELDDNLVLPAVRYKDFQEPALRNYTLADAIACSVSVPGFFQPMVIPGFYMQSDGSNKIGEHLVVKIMDGGMVDNYGRCLIRSNSQREETRAFFFFQSYDMKLC
jgi:predicted acylesterase/phospholipase RssA